MLAKLRKSLEPEYPALQLKVAPSFRADSRIDTTDLQKYDKHRGDWR